MKTLLLISLITLNILFAQNTAKTNPYLHGDHFPKGYFLIPHAMPHFMHIYMKEGGSLELEDLTEKQEAIIENSFDKTPPKVMKLAKEIQALESQVVFSVIEEGKSAEALDKILNNIASKRKEMTILKIGCLNIFKSTLTPKQFNTLKALAKAQAKH
ncbi:hypothetical protein MNB_SV-13-1420 [hydrothermal vent metagenome]|uniref:Uncharacterized protein n=1 Tax=hydrothermal vent metagenome TaxID=652676 RepID=A0A1W1CZZ5_9ZZZZ